MISSNVIDVTSLDDAKKILRIMDALEDNDDVQDVFANFDISDEILQGLGG
jgi:transcriptional/translational regulatory protein YebC/TACO1